MNQELIAICPYSDFPYVVFRCVEQIKENGDIKCQGFSYQVLLIVPKNIGDRIKEKVDQLVIEHREAEQTFRTAFKTKLKSLLPNSVQERIK